jgi:oxygen-independent coproporphyrinogen-3 oxidase
MRTVRHRKPENFISAVGRNGNGIVEEVALSPIEAADEALVMGLRLREGMDAGAIARRFERNAIVDWQEVERLVGSGHLIRNGTQIALTAEGRLVLDYILGRIAAPPEPKASAVA